MSHAWEALKDETARWHDAGRAVAFWWRDDDACHGNPALTRLFGLSDAAGVPLALAVIPQGVQPDVLEPPCRQVWVLQHGVSHVNRASAGHKKSEFPASEPVADALARLAQGRASIAGRRSLAVLVPPWNRISSDPLLTGLASAGYHGLSRFGARGPASAVPGVRQVNTHADLIDWRGTRGFAGDDAVLGAALAHLAARRQGHADAAEATGWLSHHAVHDEACWRFLATLFERSSQWPGVCWHAADSLFAPTTA